MMKRILIIQTAYIGDVILMTSLIESLDSCLDHYEIDVLVRKGNEVLLGNNPHVHRVFCWDKKNAKIKNFFKTLRQIRKNRYDLLLNLHRFLSSGLFSLFSVAKEKRGFKKNPLSLFYSGSYPHSINTFAEIHEIERNHRLINDFCPGEPAMPRIYSGDKEKSSISKFTQENYICLAPASVWPTKQLPRHKWITFLDEIPDDLHCIFIGAENDREFCRDIISESKHKKCSNLSGKLSLKESASLMAGARMNYVLDSAPLHLASAVNAPVTAVFCSTTTGFGFGPLSGQSVIIEYPGRLYCRPCGIHGKKTCPEKHFKCGNDIQVGQLLKTL